MKNRLTILTIFIVSFFNQFESFSQPQGQFGKEAAKAKITGKIIDKQSGKGMEYANIALYRQNDSSLVTGTISSPDGSFTLADLPFGMFFLNADFIGFQKVTINQIQLNPKQPLFDAGVIKLAASSRQIEGVDVIADKSKVEYKLDKKIINVGQDMNSTGGTAVDVLENTPSVKVDEEGNVSLRGSSSFTVLIDGKPSVLTGSDALQQIPAGTIENIEIITNPSAKYDPNGTSGIINVVMKKNLLRGISGIYNVTVGSNNKFRTDFSLGYRTKKWNLTLGADYSDENNESEGKISTIYTTPDSLDALSRNMKSNFVRGGYAVKGGIEYNFTDKTSLGIAGEYGIRDMDNSSTNKQLYVYQAPVNEQYRMIDNNSEREINYMRTSLNFLHKFDATGHELSGLINYSNRAGDNFENQFHYTTSNNYNADNSELFSNIRTEESEQSNDIRIKLDYTKPFSENGRFESGYQSRLENEKEDYTFLDSLTGNNNWIINSLFSNKMDFKDYTHSFYGTYSNQKSGFQYQLGLRTEFTDRLITHEGDDKEHAIKKWDIFPTLHLSKEIKNGDQIQASYSRRIERPRGWSLDPFRTYIDDRNIRQGNPDLKNEYINSLEINYMKRIKTSFVSLEGYYRIKNNGITNIQQLDTATNIMLNTFANMNDEYSSGIELMADLSLAKWFSLNASSDIYYYKLTGTLEGKDISRESTNWSARLNTTFKFSLDSRLQLTGFCNGPSVTAQGDRDAFWTLNATYRHEFLKKKLTASLSIRDIFGSGNWKSKSYGEGFYTNGDFKRETQIIQLTLSYKINNYKMDRTRNASENSEGIEMENNGMDVNF